jgi:hypothetical protein
VAQLALGIHLECLIYKFKKNQEYGSKTVLRYYKNYGQNDYILHLHGGDNVNGQNFTILFELQLESAILFHPFRLNKLQRGNKEIRNNKHNYLTTTKTFHHHSITQAIDHRITSSATHSNYHSLTQ